MQFENYQLKSFSCQSKPYFALPGKWSMAIFDEGKISRVLIMRCPLEYAESVVYQNSSLYQAIRHPVQYPGEVCFSPSSSFHHANPTRGALFCAFSGQVIASMKIYYEFGLCGAWIDLDGHYGNSIDNSRDFVKDIDRAISPVCGNINIISAHRRYLDELEEKLPTLEKEILEESFLTFAPNTSILSCFCEAFSVLNSQKPNKLPERPQAKAA